MCRRVSALGHSNFYFLSAQDFDCEAEEAFICEACRCFSTLSPLLWLLTPSLGGCVGQLTQQDINDLIFSISREFARRQAKEKD